MKRLVLFLATISIGASLPLSGTEPKEFDIDALLAANPNENDIFSNEHPIVQQVILQQEPLPKGSLDGSSNTPERPETVKEAIDELIAVQNPPGENTETLTEEENSPVVESEIVEESETKQDSSDNHPIIFPTAEKEEIITEEQKEPEILQAQILPVGVLPVVLDTQQIEQLPVGPVIEKKPTLLEPFDKRIQQPIVAGSIPNDAKPKPIASLPEDVESVKPTVEGPIEENLELSPQKDPVIEVIANTKNDDLPIGAIPEQTLVDVNIEYIPNVPEESANEQPMPQILLSPEPIPAEANFDVPFDDELPMAPIGQSNFDDSIRIPPAVDMGPTETDESVVVVEEIIDEDGNAVVVAEAVATQTADGQTIVEEVIPGENGEEIVIEETILPDGTIVAEEVIQTEDNMEPVIVIGEMINENGESIMIEAEVEQVVVADEAPLDETEDLISDNGNAEVVDTRIGENNEDIIDSPDIVVVAVEAEKVNMDTFEEPQIVPKDNEPVIPVAVINPEDNPLPMAFVPNVERVVEPIVEIPEEMALPDENNQEDIFSEDRVYFPGELEDIFTEQEAINEQFPETPIPVEGDAELELALRLGEERLPEVVVIPADESIVFPDENIPPSASDYEYPPSPPVRTNRQ